MRQHLPTQLPPLSRASRGISHAAQPRSVRRPRWFTHAALAALLAWSACAGRQRGPEIGQLPQLTSSDPQAEAELRRAQDAAARGQNALAERQLRAFLHAHPEDPLVPVAQLSLGRLVLAQKKDGEALALFESVSLHSDPAVAEQGRFYAGVANAHLGRYAQAIYTLKPMQGRTIEPEQTRLLLDTLSEAYAALGQYADAIRVLAAKLTEPLTPSERQAAEERATDLIDHRATPADIRRLLDELDQNNPAFRPVAMRALRDADAARDSARTREIVELLHDQNVPLDDELSAIALRSQSSGSANPNAVGAILSLSGRARRVGELALRGLMQAADLPSSGPASPDAPNVIFRDDAGDATRAVQAVDELANVHHVIAIVGPMDGQVAAAAGRRAQELSVPLIALAPAGNAPDTGNYVFRYFPTPDSEARALADAARSRGAQSFAVLYPNNAYGQTLAAAFEREATALGLQPAIALAYTSSATSFGAEADTLAKTAFDALFIPDSADHLALIAPALAAAGLWSIPANDHAPANARGIVLLAPSVAYNANLPRLAGRYLQGARFAVPFTAETSDTAVREFVLRFQETFGVLPDAFAAYAHDAYRLIRSCVQAGAVTRDTLARQLLVQRPTELVAPGRGFDPAREAYQPVQVFELHGSSFIDAFQAASDSPSGRP